MPQPDLEDGAPGLGLAAQERRRLRVAMLEDTVSALVRVERIRAVVVVWEHPADLEEMRGLPQVMHLVAQSREPNEALAGVEQQLEGWVRRSGRVVVAGNLPACDRRALDKLLDVATTSPACFLPGPQGRGTTVLTARAGAALAPGFGVDAAPCSAALDARPLPPSRFPTLSRDVHTLADLREAMRLGVGPATLAVARDLHLLAPERTGARDRRLRPELAVVRA
ncbi:hypothetical protein ACT8ZV_17820 [Nocardioides sp. MAHUQ-72]|uniref:hypothetical protein n=1 Tax=unclassified Nocardioides TaxID=2615069 RepID=UPI003611B95F